MHLKLGLSASSQDAYGLQSFIIMDQDGNKGFKDKSAEYSFNTYYKEYNNAVSTYNKILIKVEKQKVKMSSWRNINHLQKVIRLVTFILLIFLISCKRHNEVHAIIKDFILQNVDDYDYCGYGNIAFTVILYKEKENRDKLLLSLPTSWCSIDENQSCGKIINENNDSIDVIIYPLNGDVLHTKSLYLSYNNIDTVKLMVKKQFFEYSLDSMDKWLNKNINKQSKIYLINNTTNRKVSLSLPADVEIKYKIRGIKEDIDSLDYHFKLVKKYPHPALIHPSK